MKYSVTEKCSAPFVNKSIEVNYIHTVVVDTYNFSVTKKEQRRKWINWKASIWFHCWACKSHKATVLIWILRNLTITNRNWQFPSKKLKIENWKKLNSKTQLSQGQSIPYWSRKKPTMQFGLEGIVQNMITPI